MNHFDFTGCSVLVVGGVMLDKSLSGSVERLSPEAPDIRPGYENEIFEAKKHEMSSTLFRDGSHG